MLGKSIAAAVLSAALLIAPAAVAQAANGQYIAGLRGNSAGCGTIGAYYLDGTYTELSGSRPSRSEPQGYPRTIRKIKTTREWGVEERMWIGSSYRGSVRHSQGVIGNGIFNTWGSEIRDPQNVWSDFCVFRVG